MFKPDSWFKPDRVFSHVTLADSIDLGVALTAKASMQKLEDDSYEKLIKATFPPSSKIAQGPGKTKNEVFVFFFP